MYDDYADIFIGLCFAADVQMIPAAAAAAARGGYGYSARVTTVHAATFMCSIVDGIVKNIVFCNWTWMRQLCQGKVHVSAQLAYSISSGAFSDKCISRKFYSLVLLLFLDMECMSRTADVSVHFQDSTHY